MNELEERDYDLVISDYAFSELSRSLQELHLKRVILTSRHGYITYNETAPTRYRSFRKDELLSLFPCVRVVAEVPLTRAGKWVIAWGQTARRMQGILEDHGRAWPMADFGRLRYRVLNKLRSLR